MIRYLPGITLLAAACTAATADPKPAAPSARTTLSAKACPTKDSGARPGYDAGAGPWIRDCNTPWKREYYRVFTRTQASTTTAYLMPRPDIIGGPLSTCTRAALRPALDRYGWCAPAVVPDRVNRMSIDDALAIAHALNEDLRFTAGDGGVSPYPMPDDVALVCAPPTGAIANACAAYAPREIEIAVLPTAASAAAMASALNKLYGIP
jgi:hypothetical protein